jgi:hypothetical protein
MSTHRLRVGRIVHYVSHGTPVGPGGYQAYTSQCRAAVVTDVGDTVNVGLCVLNPTGMFFHEACRHDELDQAGGTWHWPEPAE